MKLIEIIDGIAKYGLQSAVDIEDKEKDLEFYLVTLYAESFKIKFEFDETEFPEFDKTLFPDVIDNVIKNFDDFGYYHSVLNSVEILKDADMGTGDAVDDLSDIIYDVLQIKWRIENNSRADGLWFFEFIFHAHTQQHLLDLLNFMKEKEG